MKITVTGRKFQITEGLSEAIKKKMSKLDKFFFEDAEAHITIYVQKERQIAEITVACKGTFYRAISQTNDMYISIEESVDSIERQIKKNKTKLAKRLRTGAFEDMKNNSDDEEKFEVIKIKRFSVKPIDVEEAILQMNMLSHKFFVYRDVDTSNISVVYKRDDGGYGLIETE